MAGAELGQPDKLKHLLRARLPFPRRDAVNFREEAQVFSHRQIAIERETLRHVADLFAGIVDSAADIMPADGSLPPIRTERAAQQAHGSGFPGAIRPHQPVNFSGLHGQRKISYGKGVVEGFAQPFGLNTSSHAVSA